MESRSNIISVLLVEFHHRSGPRIEYAYPALPEIAGKIQDSNDVVLPEEWNTLPFMCLPDGVHNKTRDLLYFQLPPVQIWKERGIPGFLGTVFGAAFFQQMAADKLLVRPKDVTRTNIQKSVVVLSSGPLLGCVREKLIIVTQAMFDQRDFSSKEILVSFYSDLVRSSKVVKVSNLFSSLSLCGFCRRCKPEIVLIVLKALLLEKRILFFGHNLEQLTAFQYCIISLVPDLIRHLYPSSSTELSLEDFPSPDEDPTCRVSAGSPVLATQLKQRCMPLRLFGSKSVFFPYLPLQFLQILGDATSYLVGTSNEMITLHPVTKYDLLVNIDSGTLTFGTGVSRSVFDIGAADKRFATSIILDSSQNPHVDVSTELEGTSDNNGMVLIQHHSDATVEFKGSDDDIRQRFQTYFYAALKQAFMYYEDTLRTPIQRVEQANTLNVELVTDFNLNFIKQFTQTLAFREWFFDVKEGIWPIESLDLPHCHPNNVKSSLSVISSRVTDRLQGLSSLVKVPTANLLTKTTSRFRMRESPSSPSPSPSSSPSLK